MVSLGEILATCCLLVEEAAEAVAKCWIGRAAPGSHHVTGFSASAGAWFSAYLDVSDRASGISSPDHHEAARCKQGGPPLRVPGRRATGRRHVYAATTGSAAGLGGVGCGEADGVAVGVAAVGDVEELVA